MNTFKEFLIENDVITLKGKTARPWKSTRVYKVALTDVIKPNDKVLDYGSGPYQIVKPFVLKLGAEYYPYDSYGNIGTLTSDNDVVMGSNVLNVQSYEEDALQGYNNTLDEMTRALKPTGTLVVNMPTSGPRSDWMNPAQLKMDLMKRFNDVVRANSEVFIARLPKS